MANLEPPAAGPAFSSAVTIAHVVYALHAFAIVVGLAGAATIVGSFVGSIPSILAVILNYVKRSDARGTWLDSHYRWQIRTFWFTVLWIVLALLVVALTLGIALLVAAPFLVVIGAWLVYRIARGWLRLREAKPMYV